MSKGFLENKIETLTIYISLLCQRIWRDILKEETTEITPVENVWLHNWGKSLRISFLSNLSFI